MSLVLATAAMLTSLAVQPSEQLEDVQVTDLPCARFHSFWMQFSVVTPGCANAGTARMANASSAKINSSFLLQFVRQLIFFPPQKLGIDLGPWGFTLKWLLSCFSWPISWASSAIVFRQVFQRLHAGLGRVVGREEKSAKMVHL
jgi:hypothetical protein